MSPKPATLLTTTELYNLDHACLPIVKAFGPHLYLVGSAGACNNGASYRDVDVRLMLDAGEFDAACPTRERWELLCVAVGSYLREHTGLPVDFQVQLTEIANEKFPANRNPLGRNRVFAGGGDGTPDWDARA